MAAEISLKEESAIEIGKQLAFSFQGLKAVGADTVNDGLELEEEKQQTKTMECQAENDPPPRPHTCTQKIHQKKTTPENLGRPAATTYRRGLVRVERVHAAGRPDE